MSASPLPGFLAHLGPVLDHYVGTWPSAGSSCWTISGYRCMVSVGLIAFLAPVIGDNLGYAIGRFGGRALVLRYGRYVLLTSGASSARTTEIMACCSAGKTAGLHILTRSRDGSSSSPPRPGCPRSTCTTSGTAMPPRAQISGVSRALIVNVGSW